MNGPILSIITVNFNNNLGLLKTLESVSSQSFSSYEHIIIDAPLMVVEKLSYNMKKKTLI